MFLSVVVANPESRIYSSLDDYQCFGVCNWKSRNNLEIMSWEHNVALSVDDWRSYGVSLPTG
jgi:hypothetical protein